MQNDTDAKIVGMIGGLLLGGAVSKKIWENHDKKMERITQRLREVNRSGGVRPRFGKENKK